jgi:hypothetical protein
MRKSKQILKYSYNINMKVSFLKKLRLFLSYRKIIKSNKAEILQKFGLRIDNANRLYTVLNIPEELVGEAYSLKKSDIDAISQNFIKEFAKEISTLLNSKGLGELYEIYEVKKVDKYSYLIVIGFSLFKSNTFYNRLYYVLLPTTVILGTILTFLLV